MIISYDFDYRTGNILDYINESQPPQTSHVHTSTIQTTYHPSLSKF